MNKVLTNKKALIVFVLPAFLVYFIIVIIPLLLSCYYSFFQGTPGLDWKFVGLKNYVNLLSDSKFKESLAVTLKYILMTMVGQVVLGLLLALMYRFWLSRGKHLIRTITFFPVILPTVAVGQLFRKIYEIQPSYGLLNSLLEALGKAEWICPWIGDASTALPSLAVMDIWVSVGFYAVIFYGGLMGISNDVIEASKIDGAGSWKMFWHVLFPLLRPVTITCLVFSFAGTVKMFESSMTLTGGGPGFSTTSLSMYLYRVAFEYNNYGYGSAIAIVVFLICIVGTSVIRRFDIQEA